MSNTASQDGPILKEKNKEKGREESVEIEVDGWRKRKKSAEAAFFLVSGFKITGSVWNGTSTSNYLSALQLLLRFQILTP